ncbi:MAG: hypothetical protein EBV03_00340 [Proteobacteria bacterium]|nr:hypothetical protein [Pseudomonadota bacterium]
MIAQDHLNGRRVFFYFMAFFSVIATVNGIMATLAVRTHTGLVTTHAYEKGLAYNEVISAEEKQQALGWHAGITFKDNTLIVELRDAKGKTILPTRLTAIFTRPTQAGMDFRQDLQPGLSLRTCGKQRPLPPQPVGRRHALCFLRSNHRGST